jgi:hypothetical protein
MQETVLFKVGRVVRKHDPFHVREYDGDVLQDRVVLPATDKPADGSARRPQEHNPGSKGQYLHVRDSLVLRSILHNFLFGLLLGQLRR